ncbi:uncharacterized protein LOC34623368 [Cyclospora cayetanensis]|uniref:Uncharacterized protein LOC34623368 n=1 Tax=Cyclospora cayetanensis TaxID=88456 RepID=A0A6P6RWY0_9EIME|nr:uncharacterized protein LOC34623368 [Cyclospora cayetanensis]
MVQSKRHPRALTAEERRGAGTAIRFYCDSDSSFPCGEAPNVGLLTTDDSARWGEAVAPPGPLSRLPSKRASSKQTLKSSIGDSEKQAPSSENAATSKKNERLEAIREKDEDEDSQRRLREKDEDEDSQRRLREKDEDEDLQRRLREKDEEKDSQRRLREKDEDEDLQRRLREKDEDEDLQRRLREKDEDEDSQRRLREKDEEEDSQRRLREKDEDEDLQRRLREKDEDEDLQRRLREKDEEEDSQRRLREKDEEDSRQESLDGEGVTKVLRARQQPNKAHMPLGAEALQAPSGASLLAYRRRRSLMRVRVPEWEEVQQQERKALQKQLRSSKNSGFVGSIMRRRLSWTSLSHRAPKSAVSLMRFFPPGGPKWKPRPAELQMDDETEEEVSDKCLLAFRGDAISHRADPIGRSGPRSLRLLACQMAFFRDGGWQRDNTRSLTLGGVALSASPAAALREHRLSSGALIILVSCPACVRSAVTFYVRRHDSLRSDLSGVLQEAPPPGCAADFALGDLAGIYRTLGMTRPWSRRGVVCSGSFVHFVAASKPRDFPMLVKALAGQLNSPVIHQSDVEKAFIASTSSFNAHLLYAHPRAVAMHLALKCGQGSMLRLYHGTWQALQRWAEKFGLSVADAVTRYHQQTYLPSRVTVGVVDPRSLDAIEAAIGPDLLFLAFQDTAVMNLREFPSLSSAPRDSKSAAAGQVGGGQPQTAKNKLQPDAADGVHAAADKGNEEVSVPSCCRTPALHFLECAPDQPHTLAFFSFFLPPHDDGASPDAAAAATSVSRGKTDLPVTLRARRLLVAMLAASGGSTLLGRLVSSGKALKAAVHLPISSDGGALLQIEVTLPDDDLKHRLADIGEMIFAYIGALRESPPGWWFMAEQQRLFAFEQLFFSPHDVLQDVIDVATGQLLASPNLSAQTITTCVAADATHSSEFITVDKTALMTAAGAAVALLQHLSPSRLHLLLQSPIIDHLSASVQPQTFVRFGEGKLAEKTVKRWVSAFCNKQIRDTLLRRLGLSLPRRNAFADWARREQLAVAWELEETPGNIGSSGNPTGYNTPLPSPTPRTLTEDPLAGFESLSIPRAPTLVDKRMASKLGSDLIRGSVGTQSSDYKNMSGYGRSGRRHAGSLLGAESEHYRPVQFSRHHPCYNKCSVWRKSPANPQDPRAALTLRLGCWVGQQLVPREAAAAEIFLLLVKLQTQAVREEAFRAGNDVAFSAASFAAETHDIYVRQSDSIVLSISGPRDGLEGVLLALLLPLAPPAAAIAAGVAPLDLSDAAVTAANQKLLNLVHELPRPEMLLTEMALDLLVIPQKSREALQRELRKAPIDTKMVVAWRDRIWQSLAIHATIEGNMTEEEVWDLLSMVISTLNPASLHSVSEVLPSLVVDLKGLYLLAPSVTSLSVGQFYQHEKKQHQSPPIALCIHPTFAKTAFHAVRVYVQLGPLRHEAAAAAAAAAGEWFAAALSARLQQDGQVLSAGKPPYYVNIGGVGYVTCTLTSTISVKNLILSLDAAVRVLAQMSIEEALREVELSAEWSPEKIDSALCPFFPVCPGRLNRSVQPLVDEGIEVCLRALRETPRLFVVVRGSLVSRGGVAGLGLADSSELGELEGFVALKEADRFTETLISHGFYFEERRHTPATAFYQRRRQAGSKPVTAAGSAANGAGRLRPERETSFFPVQLGGEKLDSSLDSIYCPRVTSVPAECYTSAPVRLASPCMYQTSKPIWLLLPPILCRYSVEACLASSGTAGVLVPGQNLALYFTASQTRVLGLWRRRTREGAFYASALADRSFFPGSYLFFVWLAFVPLSIH